MYIYIYIYIYSSLLSKNLGFTWFKHDLFFCQGKRTQTICRLLANKFFECV